MADISSVLEIQSSTAPKQELNISRRAQEDTASQRPLVMTEGDDSVFYSEEEESLQNIHDSVWAPHTGEPMWLEQCNSAAQIHHSGAQSSCHSIGLMEASSELNSAVMPIEIGSKVENKVNNASSTDIDVHGETVANSRITLTEELSTPPVVPLRGSTPAESAQSKDRAETYSDESTGFLPDDAEETGLQGVSSMSLDEAEQEHGLDVACKSDNKPFNHLMHTKYGSVSYRKIQRGQTRKRIEMFESMMQL